MKILCLSPYVPSEFTGHAGAQLIYRNLIGLSRSHQIFLLCFATKTEEPYLAELINAGISVAFVPVSRNQSILKKLPELLAGFFQSLFHLEPLYVAKYRNGDMINLLNQTRASFKPDIIHLEYNILHHYSAYCDGIPFVLTAHDISTKLMGRLAESAGNSLQKVFYWSRYILWRTFEKRLYQKQKYLIVLTDEDKRYIQAWTENTEVIVIPPQLSKKRVSIEVPKKEYQLIFSGSFNRQPNIQALEMILDYFVEPLHSAVPEAKIIITGRYLAKDLMGRIHDTVGIQYAGFVEDIDTLIAESVLCIAPIISGAGLKMKLTHALQCGTPVITTPVGAEGIPLTSEDGFFVENDIPNMVDRTIELLQCKDKLIALSKTTKERVENAFDSDRILKSIDSLYNQMINHQ